MPAGYGSQHISGYTGHVPGAKWTVGRRYAPPPPQQEERLSANHIEPSSRSHASNGVHFEGSSSLEKLMIDEATQSDMSIHLDSGDSGTKYIHQSSDALLPPKTQASVLSAGSSHLSMAFDSQGRPVRLPSQPSRSFANDSTQHGRSEQAFSDSPPRAQMYGSGLGRSRSLPRRRVEKDPFEGVEGGWWSKGEVMRNKERRQLADGGKTSGGQWNASKEEELMRKEWRERESDIPAAGYSGHIQGLRHLGIGKSFNTAAKEAKQQSVERRRARSGGREQFYGSQFDEGSEQLNLSHLEPSGMHSVSPY